MAHGSIDGVLNLVLALLTLGVVGVVAAVLTGFVTADGLVDDQPATPVRALPRGPLTGQALADLRFTPAVRGYRMDQVDAALDRLGAELDRLHVELALARSNAVGLPPGGQQEPTGGER